MRLDEDGAELIAGAAGEAAACIGAVIGVDLSVAGQRLQDVGTLRPLLTSEGVIGGIAARWLGPNTRPVRAVLFDKSSGANWALGWHQDRTIVVRERRVVEGFGPWSRKAGAVHVAPPFDLIERMLTVRVHLDDVDEHNAPLLIAPGSHRLGRVSVGDVAAAVARSGSEACLARTGDVWVYRTPILHASERAAKPRRRRVLQVDYADTDLPGGLEWAGV